MRDALTSVVLPLLYSLLVSGLIALLGVLTRHFHLVAGGSKLQLVGARLFAAIESIVHDLDATLKPQLLKATADGTLTGPEILQLRQTALNRLKADLGTEGLAAVQDVFRIALPSMDNFLMGLIEKTVAGLKSGEELDAEEAPRPAAVASLVAPLP